jgi:integrase
MPDQAIQPVPWEQFRARVLKLYQPPVRRPATRDKTRQILDELGTLCETTADLTEDVLADWASQHADRSARTTESLLRHLSAACTFGEKWGCLTDPFDIRPVSRWLPADELEDCEPFGKHRTAEEVRRVLDQADAEARGGDHRARRLRAAVYSFAYTGAGKKEILGLRTCDVNLDRRIITVKSHPKRRLKTGPRAAWLPIAPVLAQVLAERILETGCEWLFPHAYGTGPWLYGRPGHRPLDEVKALGERAGVPGLTILSLRHTFGTLAEDWGIGELMLQRILRHSTPRTQKHYRHHDAELLRRAAEKVRFG